MYFTNNLYTLLLKSSYSFSIRLAMAVTVISPLELFRTRMQGPEGANGFKEVMKGVQRMAKINGVSSLWRGLEPTLYRDVPFSGMNCYMYNFSQFY